MQVLDWLTCGQELWGVTERETSIQTEFPVYLWGCSAQTESSCCSRGGSGSDHDPAGFPLWSSPGTSDPGVQTQNIFESLYMSPGRGTARDPPGGAWKPVYLINSSQGAASPLWASRTLWLRRQSRGFDPWQSEWVSFFWCHSVAMSWSCFPAKMFLGSLTCLMVKSFHHRSSM